jgi:predicted nucleotidyltransferase component of viral defense system
MKLFESPDFYDAIIAATAHFQGAGLTEQLIEKDYYVTEALRVIATLYPTQVVFKGGTSLSKGWKLIDRFSEDLDGSPPLRVIRFAYLNNWSEAEII